VEPDLFFSAQDRGPRPEHGRTAHPRDIKDFKKFDGQPFSSNLYAELLKTAGVDAVVTVHNHSRSVQDLFHTTFGGDFHNLLPSELYVDYLLHSDIVSMARKDGIWSCAPRTRAPSSS
jgi:ribose-phosphate pyrophosphokinase